MGASEHLKTLCCLGLPPESAIIAVSPLLHEIIPHGGTRAGLINPDGTPYAVYNENPATSAICRERLWQFLDDPQSPTALWKPAIQAGAIGWFVHIQGPAWLNSAFYKEIEEPLDSCWILDAVVQSDGQSVGFVDLTRPRNAKPFNVQDVKTLGRLRPWLAHAFRRPQPVSAVPQDWAQFCAAGPPLHSEQMILTTEGSILFQTSGMEYFLRILAGEPITYQRRLPARDKVPSSIQLLIQRLLAAANGLPGDPPRILIAIPYGVVSLDAKWLLPNVEAAMDAAKDPRSCKIAMTLKFREHAVAHAARTLRESGATPAQVKVGIQIAMGKTRPAIAQELGLRPSSVADLTKKLYERLGVHNSASLAARIWLGRTPRDTNSLWTAMNR
ncbi:MAG TPA: hypothetical protein VFG05_07610 [Methylocella sp.]|nr:hypothetical protein [Methylocella sp.]